jgi:hypothetical protein
MRPVSSWQLRSILLLILIGAAVHLWAQRIREAKAGDIATGVVIFEDQRQLRIDATPCGRTEDKIIILFRPPFKKIPLGTVNCPSKSYTRVQVIQTNRK